MKSLALLFSGLLTCSCCVAESLPASETFSQTYPVASDVEISLSNVNGSVEITGWDKNEVALEAEKHAADKDALAKIQIDVAASEKSLSIKTKYTQSGFFGLKNNGTVSYRLHVPATAKLGKISAVNANITVTGMQGEMTLESVNGSIRADIAGRNTSVTTVNGSLAVRLDPSDEKRSVYLHTVNGGCKVALPEKFNGSFDASTVNGKITCSAKNAKLTGSRSKLQGAFGDLSGTSIDASSVNGSILFEPL